MKIDLSKYETVKERKKRFYLDHPEGSIIVECINPESILDHALFKATIIDKQRIISTGYAHEIRDKELKVSSYGKEYESVNYTSWVENCEESAVGRALDNAGYSGNDKCSQEEMKKVERIHQNNFNKKDISDNVKESINSSINNTVSNMIYELANDQLKSYVKDNLVTVFDVKEEIKNIIGEGKELKNGTDEQIDTVVKNILNKIESNKHE